MASISVSEEDLSCPVCHAIFRDPVILSCSHSLCEGCVKTFWETKGSRECPVCRAPSEGPGLVNLHLRNLCEAFQQEGRRRGLLCTIHRSEHKLFCKEDKQLICLMCRESAPHKDHSCRPISEAAVQYKEELKRKLEPLQKWLGGPKRVKTTHDETTKNIQEELEILLKPFNDNLNAFGQAKGDCVCTANLLHLQARQTEKQIKQEFEMLHQFLRNEEAARIAALREEEKQKSQMIEEKNKKIVREMASLSESIGAIEDELKADDVTFLLNYKSTVERAQCTLRNPEKLSGALINVAKHLGNLTFTVWEKMKDLVKYTPVILDPNTADMYLTTSEDLTRVWYRYEGERVPSNPERFLGARCVLGTEGFNSGTHCWDVDVDVDRGAAYCDWSVGLKTESASRRGKDCLWAGVWGIRNYYGKYEARCPGTEAIPLTVEQEPKRIRVQLDWDRGELTFTDPDNNTHLHTFTHTFTEIMFPHFLAETCHLKILPVEIAVMVEELS